MITEPEDLKKIEETLKELQKTFGIEDDEDFSDQSELNQYVKDAFDLDLEQMEKEMLPDKFSISVKINKTHEDAVLPSYNYATDSGFDFYSTKEIEIGPFGRALIPTGLRFDLPSNIELQVRSKSGLALKQGLMVLNSPGTVDNGYTNEVQVILFNTTNETVIIKKGMKVAQGVFSYVANGTMIEFEEVSDIKEKDRNLNGFGSTGLF
jgi:dUTP pyrophosphatase